MADPHPGLQTGQGHATGQGPGGLGQPVEGAGLLDPGHGGQGRGRGLPVGGRLGQPVLLGLEPVVLVAVLDGGALDLADLVAEEVDLAGPLPGRRRPGPPTPR